MANVTVPVTTGSGVGAQTAQIVEEIPVAPALSGAGALSVNEVHEIPVTGTLSGTGTLSVDIEVGSGEIAIDAALTASGAFSSEIAVDVSSDPALLGTGALTSELVPEIPIDSVQSGTGALTAEIVSEIGIDASTSGLGALTSELVLEIGIDSAQSGIGDLSVEVGLEVAGEIAVTATMAGAGALNADLEIIAFVAPIIPVPGPISAVNFFEYYRQRPRSFVTPGPVLVTIGKIVASAQVPQIISPAIAVSIIRALLTSGAPQIIHQEVAASMINLRMLAKRGLIINSIETRYEVVGPTFSEDKSVEAQEIWELLHSLKAA